VEGSVHLGGGRAVLWRLRPAPLDEGRQGRGRRRVVRRNAVGARLKR